MRSFGTLLGVFLAVLLMNPVSTFARPSKCEECHAKVTPGIVKDFNRSKMSKTLTCKTCHGAGHTSEKDVDKAQLPTIKTCKKCHPEQAEQYLAGKHALGRIAMDAMPTTHMQPTAFIAGQKGCGGCHTLGVLDEKARQDKDRQYYKYGMDCQNCHTRHAFSRKEALEPEACQGCHMGFDHPQWEKWSGSKHRVTYLMLRDTDPENRSRAPKCQTCHMPDADHRVFTAWGFLGVRLLEEDK